MRDRYDDCRFRHQKLYFTYSDYGNIADWFEGFFDTTTGAKVEAQSYRAIAEEIVEKIGPESIQFVFFSDLEVELDAAAQAGLETIQIVRPGTLASERHRRYPDFSQISPESP